MKLRTALIIAATVLTASCASPRIVASSPRSVTISKAFSNDAAAMDAAEAHCQKEGLHARYVGADVPVRPTYDCVP